MSPVIVVLVGIVGGLGALLRYVLHNAGSSTKGLLAPVWRILMINVVASFIAGIAFVALPAEWQPVAIAGFCGGLSTWSTFMTDTVRAVGEKRLGRAIGTVAGHLGYGVIAAFAGLFVGGVLIG